MIADDEIKDYVNFKLDNLIKSGKFRDRRAVVETYLEMCHTIGSERFVKFMADDLTSKFGNDFISKLSPLFEIFENGIIKDFSTFCTGKQLVDYFKEAEAFSNVRKCLVCKKLDDCMEVDKVKIKELQEDLLYCKEHPEVKVVLSTHKDYEKICMEYFQKHISENPMWYNRAMNSPHAILK